MNRYTCFAAVAVLATLVSAAAPAAAQEAPLWSAGLRGGTWSIPNSLLSRFLDEHPSVDGESFGITFCHFGESGPTGVFSVVYALDYGRLSGSGVWLADENEPEDQREGKASLDLLAVTINFMWDIMPEWRVHPYLGLGLGVAYADGQIPGEEGEEDDTYKGPAPVLQLPVGLKAKLTDTISVHLEARWFTAGVVLGGGAAISW